jgi:hypothetical protein
MGRRLEHSLVRRPNLTVEERLETLRQALVTANRPQEAVARTAGIIVRDPDQQAADPNPNAIPVQDLPEISTAYQKLGVNHLIISPEPMIPSSIERIAEAKQQLTN